MLILSIRVPTIFQEQFLRYAYSPTWLLSQQYNIAFVNVQRSNNINVVVVGPAGIQGPSCNLLRAMERIYFDSNECELNLLLETTKI
jgi:hypothetical protein